MLEFFWWGSVFLLALPVMALLLVLVDETSGVAFVVIPLVVFSVGLTPVITLATDLIVGSAPPEQATPRATRSAARPRRPSSFPPRSGPSCSTRPEKPSRREYR